VACSAGCLCCTNCLVGSLPATMDWSCSARAATNLCLDNSGEQTCIVSFECTSPCQPSCCLQTLCLHSCTAEPHICCKGCCYAENVPFLQTGLIRQQLGPAPPATASPGMMMQYTTMFEERRISLVLDSMCTLLETLAAAAVKVCAAGH
jgi:hypothetical protein